MIAGILWAGLLLGIQDYQPLAEQTWVTLSQSQLAYPPAREALTLEWQGQRLVAQQIESTTDGWRILFHERVRPPFRLYLDETLPAGPQVAAPSPPPVRQGPVICHSVTRRGETLWGISQAQARLHGRDPYVQMLALFASNRELLGNDPGGVRVGDKLRCPDGPTLAHFSALSEAERRETYRRLEAYGRRLRR